MKLIYFEGLGGFFHRALYRGLIKKIKKEFPHIEIEKRSYSNKTPIDDMRTIVIGHSWGAHRALKNVETVGLLITIDPRVGFQGKHYVYDTRGVIKYQAINFYQKGFMRGYPVDVAENFILKCSHLSMPRQKKVHDVVFDGINKFDDMMSNI